MEHAGNEGVDVMKMAVIALLTCLVVSAGAMLFYRVYGWLNDDITSMKQQALSAQLDKFFEFEDMSTTAYNNGGNYPLVTMVAQTILENQSQDILFYQVFLPDNTYYAFSSADLTSVSVTGAQLSSNPEDATAALLLQYAGHRCSLTIYGDDDGYDYPSGMYAIIIQII